MIWLRGWLERFSWRRYLKACAHLRRLEAKYGIPPDPDFDAKYMPRHFATTKGEPPMTTEDPYRYPDLGARTPLAWIDDEMLCDPVRRPPGRILRRLGRKGVLRRVLKRHAHRGTMTDPDPGWEQRCDRYVIERHPDVVTRMPDVMAAYLNQGWTVDADGRWHEPGDAGREEP